MPRIDPRRVFQVVNLTDGLVCAGALAHTIPLPACIGWVTLTQAALTGACLCPRCALVGPTLTHVETKRPQVALTFDDGPDPTLTPWVLKTLAQYHAKASFFCIGTKARLHRQAIAAIAHAGHSIENHSDHHPYRFALLGSRRLAREIDDAQTALTDLCGLAPRFFRAPFGFRNPWLAPLLAARGLCCTAWSHRGLDTMERNPARIYQRLTRNLKPGDILLLHDGRSAKDSQNRPVIHTVLPALLQNLHDRGFQAVDLPTLLGGQESAVKTGPPAHPPRSPD
ncbi:MAG: polysaccharide deacetylase family protein [Acidiferrobacter sp.]